MPANFDGVNLVVTLQAGKRTLDIETDLYSDWKEFMLLSDNDKFPPLFAPGTGTDGGNVISGILENGTYFFFANDKGWRIRPPEEDINITVFGNLVAVSSLLPILIPTIGNFTVLVNGIQPITQNIAEEDLVHSSFNEGVTFDPVNGKTLAAGAKGNSRQPLNNLPDVKLVLASRGLSKIFVKGPVTFGANAVLDGIHVVGVSTIAVNIFTFTAGCSTKDATFEGAHLTGTVFGNINVVECVFLPLSGVGYDSIIMDSIFEGVVSYSGMGTLNVLRCSSGLPSGHSEMNWTGVPFANANISEWSGGLGIAGLSLGTVAVNMVSGSLHIHSDVSGGKIELTPDDINVLNDSSSVNLIGGSLTSVVVIDAGNTSSSFKTGFSFSQPDSLKDSLIKFLSGVLKGEVKKVLSYDTATKVVVLTSPFSTTPGVDDLMKVVNE